MYCFVCIFFLKHIQSAEVSEIEARTSRHHADGWEVSLMKRKGASDFVLRAMGPKLALFKSVMFGNYQQTKMNFHLSR